MSVEMADTVPPIRTVLITGASGLLGRAVHSAFSRRKNWNVIGLAHSRASDVYRKIDLLDGSAIKNLISENLPIAVIIHCAAQRDCNKVDADFESAKKINVESTKLLAELSASIGAKFLYISTDYVFDGKNPPYKETDETNPLNKYGITKLEGEEVSIKANPDALVLRVPLLYGPVEHPNESVATGLINLFLDPKIKVEVSNYEIRYPTHVNDVADVCVHLSKASIKKANVKGIYHFSGPDEMTKYEMARIIAEEFHLPMRHVLPDSKPTSGATRPFNSHLDTSKLAGVIDVPKTRFQNSIRRCLMECAIKLGFQKE